MKSSPFGFQSVKVIALAATDVARAQRFYSETLQLEEDRESTEEVGYRIGESVLIIRQHPPTDDPNPRITLQVQDARETEKRLLERTVTISDPVKLYEDQRPLGIQNIITYIYQMGAGDHRTTLRHPLFCSPVMYR